MNFGKRLDEEKDYRGILIETNPWNSETIKSRIACFNGSILSDASGNGYVVASVPSQYMGEFMEYFKKSEARVYNIEG